MGTAEIPDPLLCTGLELKPLLQTVVCLIRRYRKVFLYGAGVCLYVP